MASPYIDLINMKSVENDLNPKWVRAIIQQESAWNTHAIRYEPNYKWTYKPYEFARSVLISLETELITQKMSWGFGQIMGALAREQGHKGLMGELTIPEVNIHHLCIRLKYLKRMSSEAPDVFSRYNAGPASKKDAEGRFPNQTYVTSVLGFLAKMT